MLGRALLLCGALSSILYVLAIDVIIATRYPDYHGYTSQMVSELIAVGAPSRGLLVWLFIPYNVLMFGFAVGVWLAAGDRRVLKLTAVALGTYGLVSTVGLLLAPMDLRGTVDSERDALHIAVTVVMSICIVATMALGAFSRGPRFRRYSFATIAAVVAFGALAGVLARPMPDATPGVGLAERVNIYLTMSWFAVLAVSLWRRPSGQPMAVVTKVRVAKGAP